MIYWISGFLAGVCALMLLFVLAEALQARADRKAAKRERSDTE